MIDSAELLRRYAKSNDEEAFAELVNRHLKVVYSAALRQVGGAAHLAEDIAQTVFMDLARDALSLSDHVVLAGWLYKHTCFVAGKVLRSERRRQEREQKAAKMSGEDRTSEVIPIAGVLDDAMSSLTDKDRTALVLRFFQGQTLRDVGAAMGMTEDTARVRVNRAIEKLGVILKRRGIDISTKVLVTMLTTATVTEVPTALATSVTAAALTTGAAKGGFAATLIKLMASTKLKMTGLVAAIGIGAGTGLVVQERSAAALRDEQNILRAQARPLSELRRANERLAREANSEEEFQKQRDEIDRLRSTIASAKDELRRLAERRTSAAKGRAADAPESFQLAALKDVGTLTPMALVQTCFWAMRSQKADRMKELFYVPESLAGAEKERFKEALDDGVANQIRKASMPEWEENHEVRFLEQTPTQTENEYRLAVQVRGTARWKRINMVIRRVNDQWKFNFQGGVPPPREPNEPN